MCISSSSSILYFSPRILTCYPFFIVPDITLPNASNEVQSGLLNNLTMLITKGYFVYSHFNRFLYILVFLSPV